MKNETEAKYGMRKAEAREMLPSIDLFPQVQHNGKQLDVSLFGPSTHNDNLAQMQKRYFHSKDLPNVTFRELTTPESISVAVYDFENLAKPKIFDMNWLQAGRIVRTSEGVYANVPKDAQGEPITDEKILKQHLNDAQKIKVGNGHIYLGNNDFGFAEYETFERGVQDGDTFAQGGLARILEHTPQVAANLKAIASPKNYKHGVDVWAFDPVDNPLLKVVGLGSSRNFGGSRCDFVGGFVFGGLVTGEASAQKINF